MKRFKLYSNYEPEKIGKIALFSFLMSFVFKGRKKDGRHKNIFNRFIKNFGSVAAVVGLASAIGAKNAVKAKEDEMSFEEAVKKYNESVGETVIDIEYDKNGYAKSTCKSTKTFTNTSAMTE